MKKYFSTIDSGLLTGRFLVGLFTLGFIVALYQQDYYSAADYVLMILLAITLNLKTKTIRNYERLTDSYEDLVKAHDGVSELQTTYINQLVQTLASRDKIIAELTQHVSPKTTRKKSKTTPVNDEVN